ncbi:helix-turn-helix transcriptional regulator [Afifella sp. IM 167]|uniref:helix-turn-helix transcriptional regulator n=1 Tax=Afifella sp. IM 167 TaxID=2033586 RepID=UPI001CCDB1E1|nr:helix-turn-helix transcriptional regulator [Afifella sp. IM 167]
MQHGRRAFFGAGDRQPVVLAALLAVQAFAAVFFVSDVIADFSLGGAGLHTIFEAAVSFALVLGVIFGGLEMRRAMERARRSEAAFSAASGALGDLIQNYFHEWALTPAESEVALFALKGVDLGDIAEMRGSAPGTVRAQLAHIYAKAGVSGRAQLVSLFIEDLLAGPMPGLEGHARSSRERDRAG